MSDAGGGREARELQALQRVLAGGVRGLDVDATLDRCLEQTIELLRADMGAVYLRDPRRRSYQRHVMRGDERLFPPTLPIDLVDARLVDDVMQHDISDASLYTHTLHQQARDLGLRHALIVRLRADDRRVGYVGLMFRAAPQLAQSTLRTLEAIGSFEAVAIENARAHDKSELRARLANLLREFGERALDPDVELPALILDTACRLSRSDRGLLSRTFERRPDDLWTRVEHGVGKDAELVGAEVSMTDPFLADALASAGPLVAEDAAAAMRPGSSIISATRERHATASFIMLTMRLRDRPFGQLLVGSGEPREYHEAEIEAMQLLASMAAQALERRRHEEELQGQRARLDAIIEHLPIVVAVVDRSGATVHLNAAGRKFQERMSSYDSDWRSGIRSFDIRDSEGHPLSFEDSLIVQAFRGVMPPQREQTLQRGGKRVVVLSVAAPLPSADGSIDSVVTAFQDVTALRELADAKDRFLSIASHELRSPITSLRATTSLLQLDPSAITDDERRAVLLGRIQRQVDRLATLVERLLDSARLNAGELPLDYADCDLCALCRDAIEHASLTDRDHRYRFEGEATLPGRWDPSRIEQVLTNLLSNAARYSPAGTEIVVRVELEGARALVHVIDQGIGIASELLPKLFAPFFRGAAAARFKGGLGLGLYITREIVRRHAGDLRVTSVVGTGSTFTVELPLSPPP
jgi:signal transduction histidine kinase/GAF domain-containing protein